jgi:hypothetical protein
MVDSRRQAGEKIEIDVTPEMIEAGVKVLEEYGPLEGASDHSPLHAAVVREILDAARAVQCSIVSPFSNGV